jgi:rubrerythrin
MGKSAARRARTAAGDERGDMAEGVGIESLDAAGYVQFVAAGDEGSGQFSCADCGYGVSVQRRLPLCPMCGGAAWEEAAPSAPLQ